jgi:SAM-dependent methyltransferase
MAQTTKGVRAILSYPIVYSLFQSFMGAKKARQNIVTNYVKPFSGMKVLDVGCGPADILAYLPDVGYWGYDINEDYITQARKKYGERGEFHCKQLQLSDLKCLPSFDLVLAIGLLHHLDDAVAINVMRLASKALKAGGRLVTIDPCLDSSQNPIAGFLIRNDRGLNVRDKAGYQVLAKAVFESPRIEVRHRAWIPYTHCFMECQK